jgi:hypothetical protein
MIRTDSRGRDCRIETEGFVQGDPEEEILRAEWEEGDREMALEMLKVEIRPGQPLAG